MSSGGQPLNDPVRLVALGRTRLLDSPAEPAFDRLTRLAARTVNAPVCLVSLVDERRQFFKSAEGLGGWAGEARQTPLTHSFCQHVVTSGAPLVVDDATGDPLVRDNLAVRDLGVMAYLGIPLRTPDGQVIGSFGVIDTKPRAWRPEEIELTREFAALVETEIALRAAMAERERGLIRQRAVLDGTTFGVISMATEGTIEVFNTGAERLLGCSAEAVVGRRTLIAFHLPEEVQARAAELSRQLGRKIEPGFAALVAQAEEGRREEREWTYVREDGSQLPVLLTITALWDEAGKAVGFLAVAQDLTERKKAEIVLLATEERLRQVLGYAECLVWEADVTLTERDWEWRMTVHPSGLYRRLSGGDEVPRGAGLWYQFNIPELEEMNRRSRAAMEFGAPGYEQEFRLVRDGRTDWIRESVSIKRTGPGSFWLVGVAVDVTEQRRAQAARDEVVARLNKLASQVPGLLYQFRLRPDGTSCFPYASEGLRAIYRVTPEEVRDDASEVFAALHPDDLAMVTESILTSARTLTPWEQEYRTRFADGTERWLLGSSLPEREEDGSVLWHGFITDITERKRAETALQATRTRLEKTFATMSEGLLLRDAHGATRECNAAAERILGLTREQITGRSARDPAWRCVRPDGSDIPDAEHPAAITLRTGEPRRDSVMGVYKPDGSVAWIEVNTELMGTVADEDRQVVCSFRDVTARREAEEKVGQSQKLLATVTGILPGLVAYWTADLRCAFANAEYREWFGRTPEQMQGVRMPDLLGPELFRRNEPYVRGVLRGEAQRFERQLPKTEGELRHTWAQYIPDFDAGQTTVKGFVVLVSDITETKRQEAALRASEAELARQKFALDQHGIVAVTDVSGHFTYVNDRFCALSRHAREELIGRHFRVVNSDHHPEEFFAEMYRAIAGGAVWHGEVCNRAKDGSIYWVDTTVVPFMDREGRPASYVTISTDITARKELAVSLAQARDQALEASRLKSEFLATMSHEIRTPMNAVIGMAGLLADTPLAPEQAEMVRTMAGGAETLLSIINDILDFSRIEAGRLRLDVAEFDFRRVVEETVSLLATRAQEKGLALTCAFDAAPEPRLLGDSGRVRQVLTNLVGNALKFTDAGAVEVRTTAKGPDRRRVRVEVRDTGVGVAREAQERLFQPFTQADGSTTRRFGGTGLGLAISRQLVELMGGKIGFESEVGRGSMFWFEVEFAPPPETPAGPGGAEPVAPDRGIRDEKTAERGLRLLLAEDNLANQRVATILLEKMGHTVTVAANGRIALAKLAEKEFDAVLMDCQMPVLDGYAAARQIRSGGLPGVNPRVPIVALTAYARAEDRVRCLEAGMDDYVTKPIRAAELRSALERRIAGTRAGNASGAPSPAMADGVFDEEVLESLRAVPGLHGPSLLRELLQLYLGGEAERLEQLRVAVERREGERLAGQAHALGGNAASFGAIQVRSVAMELERAARAGNWKEVHGQMTRLRAACWGLRSEVTRRNLLAP